MWIPTPVAAFAAREGMRRAWRIAKIAVPLLLVLGLVVALLVTRATLAGEKRDHAETQRRLGDERAFVQMVLGVTRDAARNPRLRRQDLPEQIRLLGVSVGRLRDGLNTCNETARTHADNDARRQRDAAARDAEARRRAQAMQGAIDRLLAAAARPPAGPACPSVPEVRSMWR